MVLFVIACGEPPLPPAAPERYGFTTGTRHRQLLTNAIDAANAVLPAESPPLRLGGPTGRGTPVYLVRGDSLGANEYMFVPAGENCIFVNDDRIGEALAIFSGNPAGALAVDAEHALTLMLLHEAGHVAARDRGSYTPPVRLSVGELTAADSDEKSRELNADQFAVDAIRAAATPGQPMKRFLAASNLQLALTSISWNLASRRFLDHFGATALRERKLFLDNGYSHPNFELRFLIMNYRLRPSEEARRLLNDFLDIRQQPSSPTLLGIPSF